MLTVGGTATPTMRDRLLTDHRRLELLFTHVLDAFDADAREDCQQYWAMLENGLERHFTAEERYIFPSFMKFDPAETRALREDHDIIRSKMAELGVGVELKLVRAELAHRFIEALRDHAAREDKLLYRWIDEHPSMMTRQLLEHLDT